MTPEEENQDNASLRNLIDKSTSPLEGVSDSLDMPFVFLSSEHRTVQRKQKTDLIIPAYKGNIVKPLHFLKNSINQFL